MHRIHRNLCVIGLILLIGLSFTVAVSSADDGPLARVSGKVRDLDSMKFKKGCQIAIGREFVGDVLEFRLQMPLEASMRMGVDVTVYYKTGIPNQVTRVILNGQGPIQAPAMGLYRVKTLDVNDEGKCSATLIDSKNQEVAGSTSETFIISTLVTAIRDQWKIGNLGLQNGEIVRADINVEYQGDAK